jgi:hypothetical protein
VSRLTERASRAYELFRTRLAGTSEDRERTGLRYYLLVYNIEAQRLSEEPITFLDGNVAHAAFIEAEERLHGDRHLHVVMFVARSLDSVRSTHPHYFDEAVGRGGDTVDRLTPRP